MNCRSCGAAIEFVETKAGKQMPMDVAESACAKCDGRGYFVIHGSVPDQEKCEPCDGKGRLRLSHFATCPTAAQHRKPR